MMINESNSENNKKIILGKKVGRKRVILTLEEKRERKKIYQRRYMAKKRGVEYDPDSWTPMHRGRTKLNLSDDEWTDRKRNYAKDYYQKNKEDITRKREQRVCTMVCKKLGIPIHKLPVITT